MEKNCLYLNCQFKNLYVYCTVRNLSTVRVERWPKGKQLGSGNRAVFPTVGERKLRVITAVEKYHLGYSQGLWKCQETYWDWQQLISRHHNHLASVMEPFPQVSNFSHTLLSSQLTHRRAQREKNRPALIRNCPEALIPLRPPVCCCYQRLLTPPTKEAVIISANQKTKYHSV